MQGMRRWRITVMAPRDGARQMSAQPAVRDDRCLSSSFAAALWPCALASFTALSYCGIPKAGLSMSAPALRRRRIMSILPFTAAHSRAVYPSSSDIGALASAPASSSLIATPSVPPSAAACSAVTPRYCDAGALTSAPARRSSSTLSTFPCSAALCRGVRSRVPSTGGLMTTPASRSASTTSVPQLAATVLMTDSIWNSVRYLK